MSTSTPPPLDWPRIGKLLRLCGSDLEGEAMSALRALRAEVGSGGWSKFCEELLEGQTRGCPTGASRGQPHSGFSFFEEEGAQVVTDELIARLRRERMARQKQMEELYRGANRNGGCHFDSTFKRANKRRKNGED